jgi:hypothetical protein
LKTELAVEKEYVASDSIKELADYRYHVGRICGIQLAINLLVQARERTGLEADLND